MAAGGFLVLCAVLAIQEASGVSPWRAFAPIELGSNAVATMGFAWSLLQLRSYWRAEQARRAWFAATLGMGLLSVEGNVGELLLLKTHGPSEMALSIAMWFVAAYFLFKACRRYAMRRSVMTVLAVGFAAQVAAQYVGWLAAIEPDPAGRAEALEYLNDSGELAAVLAYVVALLLAEFAPLKSYAFSPSEVGRKGRALYRDFSLRNGGRYPTRIPFLQEAGARHVVLAVMALMFGARVGPSVRRAGGPGLLRQALDLARLGAQGIDAFSYYVLSLYKASGPRDVDGYISRVETKNGLMAAINRSAPAWGGARDMSDKIAFTQVCEENRVPVAPILGYASDGAFQPWAGPEAFDRDLFVKDRKGCGGKFTLNFERIAPLFWRDDAGGTLGYAELAERLAKLDRPHGLIVQPKLANHPSVALLAETSLVVFRVVTCLDDLGRPSLTHGLVRILRRFEKGWPRFAEKEWGAAIDIETGVLGPLLGDVASTCVERYPVHPVTGAPVAGVRIAEWDQVAQAAIEAHRVFSARPIVGWDIGLTPDGPRVLEGNSNMDVAFIQRCYETPIGRSPLGPLLDRHLDRVLSVEWDRLARERS
ncbi:sugar-transfer associated ATP-grasp domain-containing protein [Chenggangzhangella methanolivorans]|uniref:Alpha-L-glutamate ligase-related protein ATP-grasp domain-containing protein n=2 Tax=Chenggangzhangella methanolivorans TaxID=1437009 RepID=A0A9E6ULA3_9HYPH|nr:sugar-transfer associated ATP-grasp domain-containing protein [Chenggangzhangella methanolivorans]QZN98710.1 hypothetical protein K6K41_17135 [Chenggangzhangella methanolivorans]